MKEMGKTIGVAVSTLTQVLLALGVMGSLPLQACPCGCTSVGPLVVGSTDRWRYSVGMSQDYHRDVVALDGQLAPDEGPTQTQRLHLGTALALTRRASASLQAGVERHWHQDVGSDSSFSDPSVGFRYALVSDELDQLSLPVNVHVFSAYKWAQAKSVLDTVEREHSLDVHSNGFSEWMAGFSAWADRRYWTLGIGADAVTRRAVEIQEAERRTKHEKAPSLKSHIMVSYTKFGTGQLQMALEREQKAQDLLNGHPVERSQAWSYGLRLTGNYRLGFKRTVSLSLHRIGAFASRNVPRRDRLALSFSHGVG